MNFEAAATLEEYRRLREEYRLTVPDHFNFGYDVVDRWAVDRPDQCALWWVGPSGEERKLTFGEIAHRSDRVAAALAVTP